MHEYSTPLVSDLPTSGNLTDDVVRNAAQHPDAVAFSRRTEEGWDDVTAVEFLAQVRGVAKGLIAAGLEAGDRVALVSRTRYEWTLLDYAIWFAGAVTVPVYETSAPEQVAAIVADSGCRGLVVEDTAQLTRLTEAGVSTDLTGTIDEGAVAELTERGKHVTDDDLESRRTAVGPGDLATLIYTSGTTGHPKGCMLTHGNFMAEVAGAVEALPELFEPDDAATLLFLPLAHVFARVIQVGAVRAGVRLGHTPHVVDLLDDLASFRPTFVLAVPRVYEKIFNTASQQAAVRGRGRAFDRAADVAIAYSRALETGRPGVTLRTRHRINEPAYDAFRAMFGGRCRYVLSGGAPLGDRLGHFLRGVGLTVLEGYGLTETTAAVTANQPDLVKIGTVGRPMPGVTVRVADDGELLVRGGQVFTGYWNDDAATAAAVDEQGWFHTGDLGEIDDEGFISVSGRKQEVIVTAGGKNVAPAPLEDRLRAHPLVSQCMLVGDNRPYVAALITLDSEAVAQWAVERGKPPKVTALTEDADLRAEIEAVVAEANKSVSQAEGIRRFRLLPDDWTEEAGHLTPSLKLKRGVLARDLRGEIERLYER